MSSVYTSIAYSFRMSLEKFSQVHDVYIQLYCDFVVSPGGLQYTAVDQRKTVSGRDFDVSLLPAT